MRFPLWFVSPILLALLPVACGGAVVSSSDTGPSSTGGPGGASAQCTPRAPPRVSGGGIYGTEALPSGACTTEPDCEMGATDCACGEHPYNDYTCSCVSGQWSCRLRFQGASICSCPHGGTGGGTSGGTSGGTTTCGYEVANNDPRCPPTYSASRYGTSCYPVGLSCAYPGVGDGLPNGCYSTAMMWCKAPASDGGLDAGVDPAASGTWVVAQ